MLVIVQGLAQPGLTLPTFLQLVATPRWAEIRQELLQTPHGRERLLAGRPRIEGVPWIDEHVASIKQVRGGQGGGPAAGHHAVLELCRTAWGESIRGSMACCATQP